MIHFGKCPNEDKVLIEVSDSDLSQLRDLLIGMSLPVGSPYHSLRTLLEENDDLRRHLLPPSETPSNFERGRQHAFEEVRTFLCENLDADVAAIWKMLNNIK